MKNQILRLSATLFGVGKAPLAPGTLGTLAFFPFVLLLAVFTSAEFYIGFTIVFIVYSVFAAQSYGNGEDLKEIVIDEAAGILVALFLVPLNPWLWILGFFLFRLFDALKPFPISYLDKNIKGGFGVVLDDLVAGLFTNMIIHFVVLRFWFDSFTW